MKNSCLVLPAHFLCNTCVDHNKKSMHLSKFACFRKEQLEKFGNSMQNDIEFIDKVVDDSLELIMKEWGAQCIFIQRNVSCLAKCRDQTQLYQHVLKYLCNKVLKFQLKVFSHNIKLSQTLKGTLAKFQEKTETLSGQFTIIKEAMNDVSYEV